MNKHQLNIVYLNGPFHKLPYSRSSRSPAVTKSGTMYYPLWLAYAAGYAQQQSTRHGYDFNIQLIDAIARKWSTDMLMSHLRLSPPDMVFCDSSTPSIYQDIRTAGKIKQEFPDCTVVMVGTHASALPEEVLNADLRVDVIVRGEYDRTCFELAQARYLQQDFTQIKGVVLRQNDRITYHPQQELIHNLDELPFIGQIYQQFLNVKDYVFSAAQFPMLMTITSRGCTQRCKWCLYPQVMHRGKYRTRSSQSVADEFAYIAEEMPSIREIGIEDDLFTGDRRRLREICDLLIGQNNKIGFWCDTRVDLDYESMRLLKAAGCRLLITGFESANQQVLENINKNISVQQSYEFMNNARRAHLLVHGCFVLGNPGETPESMQQTLTMAKNLEPDTAQFFPMIVYPGTAMYDWAARQGYLRTQDYQQWLTPDGLHNSVIDLPGLDGQQVVDFCNYARREFYLRRKYMFRKLTQSLTNVHEARRNAKAFCRLARYLVKS